ncbi:hypothetical protein GCM10009680_42980 [Streptomyces yatensis]|uniref:MmyB-like transcription regulator ligand binding domain-containing protein n=1 Tax=Streptomyces yatensis TaxID=155177 RepID=A0ABN2I441_9ACTN
MANLRLEAGRHPDDALLNELIGEAVVKVPEFSAWWDSHRVAQCAHDTQHLHHPVVGELTLRHETLAFPADPDQAVCVYTAEPGSASAEALALLASWSAPTPSGTTTTPHPPPGPTAQPARSDRRAVRRATREKLSMSHATSSDAFRSTGDHLRLVWPQWQGAGAAVVKEFAPEFPLDVARRGYTIGTAVLEAVLPPHDGPTATVPVTMTDDGLEERDGIEAKTVVLQQLADALHVISDHNAARITTLGGECVVRVASFAELTRRYGDDLAASGGTNTQGDEPRVHAFDTALALARSVRHRYGPVFHDSVGNGTDTPRLKVA